MSAHARHRPPPYAIFPPRGRRRPHGTRLRDGRIEKGLGHSTVVRPREGRVLMLIRQTGGRRGASLSRTLWRNLESLPSPQQIDRLISREVARAERNGLHFSLVLFRVRRGNRLGT